MTRSKEDRVPPETAYVVQRYVEEDDFAGAWEDIGTVRLPKRSHRQRAVLMALSASDAPAQVGDRFRVLDDESAREYRLQLDDLEVVAEP
jgi:hypothetical protein